MNQTAYYFFLVKTDDVLGIINKIMKNKPSCGSDNITGIVINKIANYTIKQLSSIINSFEEGVFPSVLKVSIVSPFLEIL